MSPVSERCARVDDELGDTSRMSYGVMPWRTNVERTACHRLETLSLGFHPTRIRRIGQPTCCLGAEGIGGNQCIVDCRKPDMELDRFCGQSVLDDRCCARCEEHRADDFGRLGCG